MKHLFWFGESKIVQEIITLDDHIQDASDIRKHVFDWGMSFDEWHQEQSGIRFGFVTITNPEVTNIQYVSTTVGLDVSDIKSEHNNPDDLEFWVEDKVWRIRVMADGNRKVDEVVI